MWYQGVDGDTAKIGYAASPDGISWNPFSTPVLVPGSPGSWDDGHVGGGCVLFDNGFYKMWYSGGSSATGYRYRIGYATAPPVGIEVLDVNLPNDYMLQQNYPNPFNPTTTVGFDLPKTSEVSLKVYNIIGKEVANLVSDRLSAGSYSYEWDASGLASGVYVYRLKADDHVETRKMILMR
jgi:hypothetical protein